LESSDRSRTLSNFPFHGRDSLRLDVWIIAEPG
jgi:hypothetical protein